MAGTGYRPFDNIECRKAVMFGMDQTAYQAAYGGVFAGGDLATTLLPPQIPGHANFDLFPLQDFGSTRLMESDGVNHECPTLLCS